MLKLYSTCGSVLIGLVFSAQSFAQEIPQPPIAQATDKNGINLGTGDFRLPNPGINIGAPSSGLSFTRLDEATASFISNYHNNMFITPAPGAAPSGGGVLARVSYGGKVYRFYVGNWSSYINNQFYISGPYWSYDGPVQLQCTDYNLTSTTGSCNLIAEDGTVVFYDRSLAQPGNAAQNTGQKIAAYGTVETHPNGEIIDTNYSSYPNGIKTVRSSLGWTIKWGGGTTAFNTSAVYCDFSATSCTVPSTYPKVTSTYNATTYQTSLFQNDVPLLTYVRTTGLSTSTTITSPSGVAKTIITGAPTYPTAYEWDWDTTVTKGGKTWGYHFIKYTYNTPVNFKATVTNPDSSHLLMQFREFGGVDTFTNELGNVTAYEYSGYHPTRVAPPEGTSAGGYSSFTYDNRGRIKTATRKAKAGTGLADQLTTIQYMEGDTTCVSPKTCNKPLWIRDANNNQTDYTYSPDHGGILTETGPADATGVRPQTRYSYTQLYPKILNASGVLVNSTPVWRLTRTSTCRVATAANPAECVTTPPSADETVTEYEYANNNLLLTKVTVRAGNANVAVTASPSNVWQSTSYDYDVVGNQIMVDGPLPGTVDRSYTVYDALRRPVYEIGVDPDGAGTLPSVAIHHMYDVDGREYRTETGRGNGTNMRTCVPTAATCTYFAVTSYVQRTYDPTTGLKVKSITAQP